MNQPSLVIPDPIEEISAPKPLIVTHKLMFTRSGKAVMTEHKKEGEDRGESDRNQC